MSRSIVRHTSRRLQAGCSVENGSGPICPFVHGVVQRVDAQHLFLCIGAHPNTRWLDQRIALEDQGFVTTGSDLKFPSQTPDPAFSAIGDVRCGSVRAGARIRRRRL